MTRGFIRYEVIFDYGQKSLEVSRLEKELHQQDFWKDSEKAKELLKKLNELKSSLTPYRMCKTQLDELTILLQLGEEEDDLETLKEVQDKIVSLKVELSKTEFRLRLSGEHDKKSAILSINAGAGGTESCDWAQMLMRMYLRWAKRKNYKVSTLSLLSGDEAGIKNCDLLIEGDYAYGYLKAEEGVHRLVRISPFDASSRRHTSFASVSILPEIDESINVKIDPKDLRIDAFRSQGAGGQHVNVTDSAIRITHFPTGIVVQSQNERSQFQNKANAMKVLRSRLYDYYRKEKEREREKLSQEKKEIAWGSQIRSYVFHPYTLVKDHRTGVERGDGQQVMDGDIDGFIEAILKSKIGSREHKVRSGRFNSHILHTTSYAQREV